MAQLAKAYFSATYKARITRVKGSPEIFQQKISVDFCQWFLLLQILYQKLRLPSETIKTTNPGRSATGWMGHNARLSPNRDPFTVV